MDDSVLAELVQKQSSRSTSRNQKWGSRTTNDDDIEDNTKLATIKEQLLKKCAGRKSSKSKPVGITNEPGGCSKNMNAIKGVETTSGKIKLDNENSVMKENRSRGAVKISGAKRIAEKEILEDDQDKEITSLKRKRGADVEISRSYLLTADRNLSRFRPRKEVPAFRMVDLGEHDHQRIVGKRVRVYWEGSRRWFIGRIQAFQKSTKLHTVLYKDGDKEELDLKKELFELEIVPSEGFNLKGKHFSQKKLAALGVSEDVHAGNLSKEQIEVSDSENVKASSKLKPKDDEAEEEEEPVSLREVGMQPERVKDALDEKHYVTEGSEKILDGIDHGGLGITEEVSNGMLEVQNRALKLHSVLKEIGLEDGHGESEKNAEAVKDVSRQKGASEQAEKNARSRKAASSIAAKRRRSKLSYRGVRQRRGKLDAGTSAEKLLEESEEKKTQTTDKDGGYVMPNVEKPVLASGEVKENMIIGEIRVEVPKHVKSKIQENGIKSPSKVVGKGACKASNLQIMQGEANVDTGESNKDKAVIRYQRKHQKAGEDRSINNAQTDKKMS